MTALLVVKSCHSAMREVKVLHDYLLDLFNQNQHKPKKNRLRKRCGWSWCAMLTNTPYIQAVFGANGADAPVDTVLNFLTVNCLKVIMIVSNYLSLLNLKKVSLARKRYWLYWIFRYP